MKMEESITPEDFLRWLCKKRIIVEEDGTKKVKSFRFGNSVWIVGSQALMAKEAMLSKETVNKLIRQLEEDNYIHYVGLWTYELTNKGLEVINSKKRREYNMPSDYMDYVKRVRKNGETGRVESSDK